MLNEVSVGALLLLVAFWALLSHSPELLCRHERTNTTFFKEPGRSHCGCRLSPPTELSLRADLTSAGTSHKCLLHPQCPCSQPEADSTNHVFTSFHLV